MKRILTIDEKITIRGQLAKKMHGLPVVVLIRFPLHRLIDIWYRCYGSPISYAFTPKKIFHKAMRR